MRQESDVEQTIGQYADMVKHICFVYMKNESDTEDVFQDVFLKYALFSEPFDSEEHKKAWLIRVTVNRCKDLLAVSSGHTPALWKRPCPWLIQKARTCPMCWSP